MCMAIPSRVVRVEGDLAWVESFGVERRVNTMLLAEPVFPGAWLLVRAGGLAYEQIDAERAHETLLLMQDVLASTAQPAAAVGAEG